jgi:hypothetical protein
LNPIDVGDEDAKRWLEACVFADNVDRLERLRGAMELARDEPPEVVAGDLLELVEDCVAQAPGDATTIVFHSAVLAQVDPAARARFEQLMRELDVVWLSYELPMFVEGLKANLGRPPPPNEICFLLARNGVEPLAFAHAHGRWLEWFA